MNERTKESKFLDAINKYAESQKAQIAQEIEDYKNTMRRLKKSSRCAVSCSNTVRQ